MVEKRVEKLEKVVAEIGNQIAGIASDFKYMRERIHGYLETHDKVIRLEEKIKVANNRIYELEQKEQNLQSEITKIKVNYATVSAIVSIIVTFTTTLLFNTLQ